MSPPPQISLHTHKNTTTYLTSPSRQKLERVLHYRKNLWHLRHLDAANAPENEQKNAPHIQKSAQMRCFMLALPELQPNCKNFLSLKSQLPEINTLEFLHLAREMCRIVNQHFHEKYRLHCRICPEAFGFVVTDGGRMGSRPASSGSASMGPKTPTKPLKSMREEHSASSTTSSILNHSTQLTFTGHMLFDVRRVSPHRPCLKMQRAELLHTQPTPPNDLIAEILSYTAPEMRREGRFVDRRSDIYSLGCVFYWMLTRQTPMTNPQIVDSAPTPLHELNPQVPLLLSQLIHKMIQLSPEDRYQTLAGVSRDIEYIYSHFPSPQPDYPLASRDVDGIFEWIRSDQLIGMKEQLATLQEHLAKFLQLPNSASQRILVDAQNNGQGRSHFISHFIKTSGIKSQRDLKCIYFSTTFDALYKAPFNSVLDCIRDTLRSIIEFDSRGIKEEVVKDFATVDPGTLGCILQLIPEMRPFLRDFSMDISAYCEFSPSKDFISSRLSRSISLLFETLTRRGTKVFFCLEDLHHADEDCLAVVRALLQVPKNCFVLISTTQQEYPAQLSPPTATISLTNAITEYDICQLLSEVLRQSSTEISPLATFLCEKTGGNILFIRELVCWLQKKRWIRHDLDQNKWTFDIGKIRALSIPHSLSDMLAAQFQQKSKDVQDVLSAAAYCGVVVRFKKLCQIAGKSLAESCVLLEDATRDNWVQESEHALKFDHNTIRMVCSGFGDASPSQKPMLHRLALYHQKHNESSPTQVLMHIYYARIRHELEDRHALIRMALTATQQCYSAGLLTWAFRFASMARNATVLSDWNKEYELAYESTLWWCRVLSYGVDVSQTTDLNGSMQNDSNASLQSHPADSSHTSTPKQSHIVATKKLLELHSKLPHHDHARRLNILKDVVAIYCEHHAFDEAYEIMVTCLSDPNQPDPSIQPILNTSSEDEMHQWLGKAIHSVSELVQTRFVDNSTNATTTAQTLPPLTNPAIKNLLGMISNGMPAFFHAASAKKLVFSQIMLLFANLTISKGHCPATLIGLSVYTIIHFTFTKEFSVSHLLSEYCVSLVDAVYDSHVYCREAAVAWYIRAMWPLEDSAVEQKDMYAHALKLCLQSHADTWVNYCALYYLSSSVFCGVFDGGFFGNLEKIEEFSKTHVGREMHAQLGFYCENIRGTIGALVGGDKKANGGRMENGSPESQSPTSHTPPSYSAPNQSTNNPFYRYTTPFLASIYSHLQNNTEQAFQLIESSRAFLPDVIPFNYFFWHPFWEVLICSDMIDHVHAHATTRFSQNTQLIPALKDKLRSLHQQMDIYHKHFKLLFQTPCALVDAELSRHHVNTYDHLTKQPESERQVIDKYTAAMQQAADSSPLMHTMCSLRLTNYLKSIAFKPQFVALQVVETIRLFEVMGCSAMCDNLREEYGEYLKQGVGGGGILVEHLMQVDELSEISQINLSHNTSLNVSTTIKDAIPAPNTIHGDISNLSFMETNNEFAHTSTLQSPLSRLIQNTIHPQALPPTQKSPHPTSSGTTEASIVSIRTDNILNIDSPLASASVVFRLAQKLLDAISPPVTDHHGFIHEITHEGVIIAVFPNHITQAVLACMEISERLGEVMWRIKDATQDRTNGKTSNGQATNPHITTHSPLTPGIAIDYGKIMIGSLSLSTHRANFACGSPFTQCSSLSRLSNKLQIPIICTQEIHRQLQSLHAPRIGCRLICKLGYFSSTTQDLRPTTNSSVEIFEIFNPSKMRPINELPEIQSLFSRGLFLKCLKLIEHTMRFFPTDHVLSFYRRACSLYNEYELPSKWNGEVKLNSEGVLEPISFVKRRPGEETQEDLQAEVLRLRREVYNLKHGEGKKYKGNKYNVVWDESEKKWLREEIVDDQEWEGEG